MRPVSTELPFVDEHSVEVPAPRDVVWSALERYVARSLQHAESSLLPRVLGTTPDAGFLVSETVPAERLVLAGSHRFSRYRLELELSDAADGATRLTALTYAAFPGLHGAAYRALVIGTRIHVLATRRLLRSFRDSLA